MLKILHTCVKHFNENLSFNEVFWEVSLKHLPTSSRLLIVAFNTTLNTCIKRIRTLFHTFLSASTFKPPSLLATTPQPPLAMSPTSPTLTMMHRSPLSHPGRVHRCNRLSSVPFLSNSSKKFRNPATKNVQKQNFD